MSIRKVRKSDARQIAAIYNPFIRNSVATFEELEVSPEEIESRISKILDAGLPYLVSETNGELSGYAYASLWKARAAYRHTAEVSVYIEAEYQGQGLARALYDELFSRLRRGNFHAVMGVITLPNEASIRLHESFGLKKAAHFSEVGKKFGRWIDVGYWQGFLDEGP